MLLVPIFLFLVPSGERAIIFCFKCLLTITITFAYYVATRTLLHAQPLLLNSFIFYSVCYFFFPARYFKLLPSISQFCFDSPGACPNEQYYWYIMCNILLKCLCSFGLVLKKLFSSDDYIFIVIIKAIHCWSINYIAISLKNFCI